MKELYVPLVRIISSYSCQTARESSTSVSRHGYTNKYLNADRYGKFECTRTNITYSLRNKFDVEREFKPKRFASFCFRFRIGIEANQTERVRWRTQSPGLTLSGVG